VSGILAPSAFSNLLGELPMALSRERGKKKKKKRKKGKKKKKKKKKKVDFFWIFVLFFIHGPAAQLSMGQISDTAADDIDDITVRVAEMLVRRSGRAWPVPGGDDVE
jgi:hypothetical protein